MTYYYHLNVTQLLRKYHRIGTYFEATLWTRKEKNQQVTATAFILNYAFSPRLLLAVSTLKYR